MLVLGPGSTHLVTAANLWPWYDHIESCVAMHKQHVNCLVNNGFSLVNARLLIMCGTAFYAIMLFNKYIALYKVLFQPKSSDIFSYFSMFVDIFLISPCSLGLPC